MAVTLEEVLTKTGVRLKQLNKRVNQEALHELAKHCDPLTVIGDALRLRDEQVKRIDQGYHETEEKRLALVKEWMHSFGADATYRRFVEALLGCERASQAEKVCNLVSKMGGHDVDTTPLANRPVLFGILVDASGSMQSALVSEKSAQAIAGVKHTQSDAILNIIKNFAVTKRAKLEQQDSVFVGAIGLGLGTCDLISLLENHADSKGVQFDAKQALIELAKKNGAAHIEPWISKLHLSPTDSKTLYDTLCSDKTKLQQLIKLIPSKQETAAANALTDMLASFTGKGLSKLAEDAMVHESEAHKFVKKIIGGKLQDPEFTQFKARPVKEVSDFLDELLQQNEINPTSSSETPSSNQIQEVIESYVYGLSPMVEALEKAKNVFDKATGKVKKVLFLLSDGDSTDGDPRPIAKQLCDSGVIIATCYLTSEKIDNPKRLYDTDSVSQFQGQRGKQVLFEMSSTLLNTQVPICYLTDGTWKLPRSGASRLFIQANSHDGLDVVEKFIKKLSLT